jgi:uncharacterized protein
MDLKLSKYIIYSSEFIEQRSSISESYFLLFSTRSNALIKINKELKDDLDNLRFDKIDKKMVIELLLLKILVLKSDNELNEIITENKEEIESNTTLYEVLQPTASCQLGCNYCGQHHFNKKISLNMQKLFIEKIKRKIEESKYEKLEIGWFGAEPLIALDVLKNITESLIKICIKNNIQYESKVVTNGILLTKNIAYELQEKCNVKNVEITLDGTKEFHDVKRMKKNGGTSFDIIFKNLCDICNDERINLDISIRSNVDRYNKENIFQLLKLFKDNKLESKINFYPVSIYSWGNDADKNSLSKVEFASFQISILEYMLKEGFNISLLPKRKKIVCLAVNSNSEVVDANGDTYNCTEIPYVKSYENIGGYKTGNIKNNKREITFFNNFNDLILQNQYECFSCKMLPVCGGSCPKQWQEGNAPCPPSKFNIIDKLNLIYKHGVV